MSTSVLIILDTRRIKTKQGKYPVKLLVIYNRQSKRYQTNYDLSQDEFDNLPASRIAERHKVLLDTLKQIQRNAEDSANRLQPFNYQEFEKDLILRHPHFRQRKSIKGVSVQDSFEFDEARYLRRFAKLKLPKPEPDTILAIILFYIRKLLSEHRIRTTGSYQTAYTTISRFQVNKTILTNFQTPP